MNKISTKQFVFIVIGTIFSPAVRLFSVFYSENVTQEAWLGPLLAGGIAVLAVCLFKKTVEKHNFSSLLDVSCGKTGKIIGIIYILWGIMLTAINLHYYGHRIATTVYKDSSIDLFIITMGCLCVLVLVNGIETFARMNEIIVPAVASFTVVLIILLVRNADVKLLLPIHSAKTVAESMFFSLGSFCYVMFGLFISERISDKNKFFGKTAIGIAFMSIVTAMIFCSVIGIFGSKMIYELDYPFFGAVKQINIGEFIQHIEAFVILLWVMSDFVIAAFIGLSMFEVCSYVFGIENRKLFVIPYYAVAVSVADMFSVDENKVHILSEKVFLPLNLLMLIAVPFVLICIAKIKERRYKMN